MASPVRGGRTGLTATPIEHVRHSDMRVNNPTEELRDFVAEDEEAPKTLRYPRDPSLDPQLVWKGKDEQNAEDLVVPVVPIYIQEKIHPRALIEDLRVHARHDRPALQTTSSATSMAWTTSPSRSSSTSTSSTGPTG